MNNDIVTISLDKERTLKFRRKELKLLEKTFNKKIAKINFEEVSVDDISKIIHIGLQHEDPDLTLEKVEELVDEYPYFGVLFEKAMEAFSMAMAGPDAYEQAKQAKQLGNAQPKN